MANPLLIFVLQRSKLALVNPDWLPFSFFLQRDSRFMVMEMRVKSSQHRLWHVGSSIARKDECSMCSNRCSTNIY